ncbi:hypothetical protein N7481_007333 [Penicillium waksmanii]|uniref:uncharacterized protein n=1 Tax=Penicillium waksmanii TaxID=69791 RepID=UPI002546F82A|nr:uncharacterized protein N7481_007333 [Penicillium waksmanii]KAJ5980035.1 hypothetical protein N7481_007333 [Penicillium waksmanii]
MPINPPTRDGTFGTGQLPRFVALKEKTPISKINSGFGHIISSPPRYATLLYSTPLGYSYLSIISTPPPSRLPRGMEELKLAPFTGASDTHTTPTHLRLTLSLSQIGSDYGV